MLAVFGLLAWVFAALCGVVVYKVIQSDGTGEHHAVIWQLGIAGAIAFVAGICLFWIGWRMARKADMSEPDNPKKPMARF